jgi:hypothetical protein
MGATSFAQLTREGTVLVDRSQLIIDLMDSYQRNILVTSPKGTGKSMAVSMLKEFLAKPPLNTTNEENVFRTEFEHGCSLFFYVFKVKFYFN